jgi:hypothetical protein
MHKTPFCLETDDLLSLWPAPEFVDKIFEDNRLTDVAALRRTEISVGEAGKPIRRRRLGEGSFAFPPTSETTAATGFEQARCGTSFCWH